MDLPVEIWDYIFEYVRRCFLSQDCLSLSSCDEWDNLVPNDECTPDDIEDYPTIGFRRTCRLFASIYNTQYQQWLASR